MKILFVTHQFPYPLDVGSRIRAFHLLRQYALCHEVTLLSLAKDDAPPEQAAQLRRYAAAVHVVPLSSCLCRRRGSGAVQRAVRFFDPLPSSVRGFYSPAMGRLLEKIAVADYDVVHCESIYVTALVPLLKQKMRRDARLILNLDDCESVKKKREMALMALSRDKMQAALELVKLRRYEDALLPQFHVCLTCSDVDRQLLAARYPAVTFGVVPNGVDTGSFRPGPRREVADQMLYLGAMNYEPNSDAVRYFCREILPRIRRWRPRARFVIAGKNPPAEVQQLHDGSSVVVQGYVRNVPAVFEENPLFVVPLRAGGGTRIKILEAMAMGKAVVSTSIGCEGIAVTRGKNIVIADQPEGFARACAALLADPARRRALGEEGRRLVNDRYDWNMSGARLLQLVQ